MRRIFATLTIMMLLLSQLAACGGQTTTQQPTSASQAAAPTTASQAPAASAATNAPVAGGQKTKIRLATWAGVDEAKELQAVIDKINATATTFEIIQEAQPADYYTKLQTNLAGSTAADLLWLSQEYIADYAQKGALLDISDRLAKDSRPAAKLDDYYPSVLQTAQFDGKTFGLPWIAQPVMLYYNPKMFADAGVEPPN